MRFAVLGLVGAVVLACASLAPKPKPVPKPRFAAPWVKACSEDSEKYCKRWNEKDGTTMDCLARAEKELSGGCYQQLREAASPCVFDRARWCPELKPSDPRVWNCLTKHGKSVSLSCRSFRTEVAAREKSLRQSCAADAEKLCSGEIEAPWHCLRENLARVSPGCRGEVARSFKGRRRAG